MQTQSLINQILLLDEQPKDQNHIPVNHGKDQMTLENPYKHGKYVIGPQFYGRVDILRCLEQDDYHGAYVIGTRQIGKTSLLREMERRLPAFYLDLNSLADDDLAQWANYLRRSINKQRSVYKWLPDSNAIEQSDFFTLLEQAAQAAENNSQNQRIWLLLDEAEDLITAAGEHPRLLPKLRGIMGMQPNLRLVLAGYRNLLKLRQITPPQHSSPFLGGFISFILPPLSEKEATALIRQEQTPPCMQVEDTVVREILIETGGHPYLLQRLCNYLWHKSNLIPLDGSARFKLDGDAENIFPADFGLLTEIEQQILFELCQSQEATFAEMETLLSYKTFHLPKTLQDLVDFGFIYRTSTAYAVSSQTLTRWLRSLKYSDMPPPLSDPTVIEPHSIDEQEQHFLKLLKTHQDNLYHYEEIKAKYGFDVPLHVVNGIKIEEEAIQTLQQELAKLKAPKIDH
ncbi:MAG: hypothetical protein HC875_14415 [Anaerolineales bacterium]|nr:hypothetical protein [Anaerolineales bacterium]